MRKDGKNVSFNNRLTLTVVARGSHVHDVVIYTDVCSGRELSSVQVTCIFQHAQKGASVAKLGGSVWAANSPGSVSNRV